MKIIIEVFKNISNSLNSKLYKRVLFGFILFELILISLPMFEAINSRKVLLDNIWIQSESYSRLMVLEIESHFDQELQSLSKLEEQLLNLKNKSESIFEIIETNDMKYFVVSNIELFSIKHMTLSRLDYQSGKYLISSPIKCFDNQTCIWIFKETFIFLDNKPVVLSKLITLTDIGKILSSVNLGKSGFVSLTDRKNILYERSPKLDNLSGKIIPKPKELESFLKSNSKTNSFIFTSNLTKELYISTFSKVLNDQFILKVSFLKDEALKDWNRRVFIGIIVLGMTNLLFIIFIIVILFSIYKLEEKNKQAIQLSKLASIGEMSTAIAHEINNPLMVISGQALKLQKINSLIDTGNDEIINSASKIISNVNRITKIILALKSYARDSHLDPLQVTSLRKVLNSAIDLTAEKLKNNSVKFELVFTNDIDIECREIQIEQVLINLINNSCDAISKLESRWIKIIVYDLGYEISIKVIDSGKGIPDELADKIMEPFFTTKEIGKGTGLGLSISQGILNNHHGRLLIDKSCENTCFEILIPKVIDFEEAIEVHKAWKIKLSKYIRNPNGSLDEEVVMRDDQCKLGCWIYGKGNIYASMCEYDELKTNHARFHQVAGNVVKIVNSSSKLQDEKKLIGEGSEYNKESMLVIETIEKMKIRYKKDFN